MEFPADPALDLFAAGCVLLEAAVWVTGGRAALKDFRRFRQNEIQEQAADLHSRGHRDCFHNGFVPLLCVAETAETLKTDDPLTSMIVEVVLSMVLEKAENGRMAAMKLFKLLDRVIIEGCMPDSPLSPEPLEHRPDSGGSDIGTSTMRWSRGTSQRTINGYRQSKDGDIFGAADKPDESPGQGGSPGQGTLVSDAAQKAVSSTKEVLPYLTFEEVREWRKRKDKDMLLTGLNVALKHLKKRDHVS